MKYNLILLILLFAMSGKVSAQSNTLKHKHGDWYFGIAGGFSQSLAENAVNTDFITHQIPSANILLGHNFSPTFGFRLTGGLNMQSSRVSKIVENALPHVYGNGRYSFRCFTGTLSGVVNLTNLFFGYDDDRVLTWNFLFGAGYLKTFDFDKKIDAWNEYDYYPINGDGGKYVVAHLGVQCAVRLSEPWDLAVELRTNATDNDYNGVSNGNNLDFYLDLMVNFVYHFKNGKQGLRRFTPPKRGMFIDPVLRDHSRDYTETVRMGEEMHTKIPFYAGFYYLNDASSKGLVTVANFLKAHPDMKLNIVGHPDILGDEDMEFHRHLALKRAETVYEALTTRYKVDAARLRVSTDDAPLQSYKTLREWIPAVTFVME